MSRGRSYSRRSSRFLRTPLHAAVLALAWPVLAEQVLGFGVGLFDTWLSGRLGAGVTAAVGLAAYVAWLATMLFGVVSVGATAIVARHWGAGEKEDADAVANRVLALGFGAGLLYLAALWPLAPWLARGLNLEGEAFAIAVRYLRVDGVGQVVTAMSLAGFAALRGAGDMTTPMWLGAATNLVNAAASWAFVYGLEPLGLEPAGADGIVFGTVVARVFGGAALIAVLAGGTTRLRLVASQLVPDAATTRRVLAIGVPAAFDGAVRWAGHYAFMALISRLGGGDEGEVVFAAHVVAVRLEAITYLPAMAWGSAAATLVGQGLGGNRVGRARRVGHVAAGQCAILGAAITAAFVLFAPALVAWMHESDVVRSQAAPALRVLGLFQVPLTASIVYVYALRGAGETRVPLGITLLGMYGVRLPLAWACGVWAGFGLPGAYCGMGGDVACRASLAGGYYAAGGWWRRSV